MKLALALVLVPSLALADVPPPAPIPGAAPIPGVQQEPTSPIAAQPAGGYTVLPALPSNPSRGRKIGGGVMIATGVAMVIIGIVVLGARPRVPDISAPGWYDAQSTYDGETVGGIMLIGGGAVIAAGGGVLLGTPSAPYGELPGAPLLTF